MLDLVEMWEQTTGLPRYVGTGRLVAAGIVDSSLLLVPFVDVETEQGTFGFVFLGRQRSS